VASRRSASTPQPPLREAIRILPQGIFFPLQQGVFCPDPARWPRKLAESSALLNAAKANPAPPWWPCPSGSTGQPHGVLQGVQRPAPSRKARLVISWRLARRPQLHLHTKTPPASVSDHQGSRHRQRSCHLHKAVWERSVAPSSRRSPKRNSRPQLHQPESASRIIRSTARQHGRAPSPTDQCPSAV